MKDSVDNLCPMIPVPVREQVTGRFVNMSTALSGAGFITTLKQEGLVDKAKDAVAPLIVAAVEGRANRQFHENLSPLEKLGFVGKTKMTVHMKRIGFQRGLADLATRAGVDILIAGLEYRAKRKDYRKLADFVAAAAGFVDGGGIPSAELRGFFRKWSTGLGQRFDEKRFRGEHGNAAGGTVSGLPVVPEGLYGSEYSLFTAMTSFADVSDDSVRQRAMELGDFLGLKERDVSVAFESSCDAAELVSGTGALLAFSLSSVLDDLYGDVQHARQAGIYSLENDPYTRIRAQRRGLVIKGGIVAAAAGGTLLTGPLGDIVIAGAAPLAMKFFEGDLSAENATKVFDGFRKVKKEMLEAKAMQQKELEDNKKMQDGGEDASE